MVQSNIVNTGEVGSAMWDWFRKCQYILDLPQYSSFYSTREMTVGDDRTTMLIYKDRTIAIFIERRDDFNYVELTKILVQ